MNEDEFRRTYIALEKKITVSEGLKRKTKKSLAIYEAAKNQGISTPIVKSFSTSNSDPVQRERFPTGAVLSLRWKAVVACFAVLAGIGILYGTGYVNRIGAAFAGNSFSLVAYADESQVVAHGPIALGFDSFYPTRTSAGYLYDPTRDSVDYNIVTASRYYVFDLTVAGSNLSSVSYSIDGPCVSYGSWKNDLGSEGTVERQQSSAFEVSFDEDNKVIREIGINYVLEEKDRAEFDRLYAAGDSDGIETLLAVIDAKYLSETSLTVTATFFDGTTQSKAYGFYPVDGFQEMYGAYLDQLDGTNSSESWTTLAGEPALFKLIEQ